MSQAIQYRPASKGDLPSILELTRIGLGGNMNYRSEEFWRWKHELNPFGPSLVLVAENENGIIGLRTLMKWRFRYLEKTIDAFRPVDTVVHPAWRRKGIFEGLTTLAIENISAKTNSNFVFNTPNKVSGRGYEKMGWIKSGKTNLLIAPYPINILKNKFSDYTSTFLNKFQLPEKVPNYLEAWYKLSGDLLMTDYSSEFLQWRYGEAPGLQYQSAEISNRDEFALIIFRQREVQGLRELRVVELFHSGQSQLIRELLDGLNTKLRPDVISLLDNGKWSLKFLLPFQFFRMKSVGYDLYIRQSNSSSVFDLALDQRLRYWSAGTLELF